MAVIWLTDIQKLKNTSKSREVSPETHMTDQQAIKFVVGARPPQFSEATKKKLDRQRPSKKAAQLLKNIAKAKVIADY